MTVEDRLKTCTVCGYEYDPLKGDPANGIPPGTPWEEVDINWLCPDCQMPKSDFE